MRFFFPLMGAALCTGLMAQNVQSPDGRLQVSVQVSDKATYSVSYDGQTMLQPSSLGLVANYTDFSQGLKLDGFDIDTVRSSYDLTRTKASHRDYVATRLLCHLQNAKGHKMDVEFRVDNNNVAFRYHVLKDSETGSIRVMSEATSFAFPEGTTTFLTPQSLSMVGWKRTKPSYEEEYVYDAPMSTRSAFGKGWTFPCLFKTADSHWVLVSETGVDSRYCGGHLSDSQDGVYSLAFPMPEENNGNGTIEPAFALPGATPWRTLAIGNSLKPIVETQAMYDVVEPRYTTQNDYKFGKGTWSWILWQDNSINYQDQIRYIELAAGMGFQYVLVDNWWDTNIGRKDNPVNGHSIEDVIAYAHQKGVDVFLWYSSSGYWNDIVQGPINNMDNSIRRKQEMKWMQEQGVKGIKVDFFGGDKQETMRLYEEILSDADDHGLMVIFHGCTIPRGWERMYPNYVGSEAVLASENMFFDRHFCEKEAQNACTHPFIRNAIGCMEWGGCFMNRQMDRSNQKRHPRITTDVAELATTVLFQNPIQNFALAPNNLWDYKAAPAPDAANYTGDAPKVCMDYLREVPTTWDETLFLDGYPGRYVAMARRQGQKWYVAILNAQQEPLKITLDLNAIPGLDQTSLVQIVGGNNPVQTAVKTKKGKATFTILCNDGVVLYNK